LSANPEVAVGAGIVRVVASGASTRSVVAIGVAARAPSLPVPSERGMVVHGCAGYDPGVLGEQRAFGSVYVGAWRRPDNQGFCSQVLSDNSGWYALQLADRCFSEGESVYLTAGGLPTNVNLTYRAGTRAFAEVLGSR
jgi:hypothetical protein